MAGALNLSEIGTIVSLPASRLGIKHHALL
jgi:hypothetical protein